MKNLLLFTVLLFIISSCEKPAGEGGTSKINGNVTYYVTSYNAQSGTMDTTYYPVHFHLEDVFSNIAAPSTNTNLKN